MVTHIVSDMGGVLVHLEWQTRVESLLGRPMPMDALHQLWVNASSTLDFETGITTFEEFADAFVEEFDLAISPGILMAEFLEIVQAPMENCNEVLAKLKPKFHLSLLSNTNPAHYQRLRSRYTFFDYFDQLFLSYQIGHMKPSEAVFKYVIDALETAPANIAFFDDGQRNVAVARKMGLQAFQVESPTELLAVVSKLQD